MNAFTITMNDVWQDYCDDHPGCIPTDKAFAKYINRREWEPNSLLLGPRDALDALDAGWLPDLVMKSLVYRTAKFIEATKESNKIIANLIGVNNG